MWILHPSWLSSCCPTIVQLRVACFRVDWSIRSHSTLTLSGLSYWWILNSCIGIFWFIRRSNVTLAFGIWLNLGLWCVQYPTYGLNYISLLVSFRYDSVPILFHVFIFILILFSVELFLNLMSLSITTSNNNWLFSHVEFLDWAHTLDKLRDPVDLLVKILVMNIIITNFVVFVWGNKVAIGFDRGRTVLDLHPRAELNNLTLRRIWELAVILNLNNIRSIIVFILLLYFYGANLITSLVRWTLLIRYLILDLCVTVESETTSISSRLLIMIPRDHMRSPLHPILSRLCQWRPSVSITLLLYGPHRRYLTETILPLLFRSTTFSIINIILLSHL